MFRFTDMQWHVAGTVVVLVLLSMGALFLNKYEQGTVIHERDSVERGGARFQLGTTTWGVPFLVGERGGTWEVEIGTYPPKRVGVVVPAGAVVTDTPFAVGINHGSFAPAAGKPGELIVVVKATDTSTFGKPVSIEIDIGRSWFRSVPVGYTLDEAGAVRLLDAIWNSKTGVLTVETFQPLTFTWVYP